MWDDVSDFSVCSTHKASEVENVVHDSYRSEVFGVFLCFLEPDSVGILNLSLYSLLHFCVQLKKEPIWGWRLSKWQN